MEGIELLNFWKAFLYLGLVRTWRLFMADRKILLTESDFKCQLYKNLTLVNPEVNSFACHTEVTHFHFQQGDPIKRYRFRDISLLNPRKIRLNEEIWEPEVQHLKGFKHVGEAIFIELKFQRQLRRGVAEQAIGLNIDIDNLKNYRHNVRTPKLAYLIWASQKDFNYDQLGVPNNVNLMITALTEFSNYHENNRKIPNNQVFGFVLNHLELWEIIREDNNWISRQII